jgi:polysaccharide biosynthesis transport protein
MSFTQLLTVLRARWLLALSLFALSLGVALALSLLLPQQFTATASVVVDVKTADPIAGALSAAVLAPSYMATQVDIMQSDRVAARVVRNLKLSESGEMRRQWDEDTGSRGNFEVWLGQLLSRKLDVKPARESNVIEVHFTSVDARFAAAVTNAFVQAYLDTTLDLRVDPARRYSSFFDERAKRLREDLERAQARLSALQNRKGIMATDERLDVDNARLNELSTQLVMLQAASADARSRQVAADTAAETFSDVFNNPVVAGLRADVARLEARQKELSARVGDNHPALIELRANLAELRARMEQETRRLSASVGVSSIVTEARESQLRQALEAQRGKVLRMKSERDEIAVMQRDVEQAQRAYDGVVARLTQASLESLSTQTNASLLMAATEPTRASFPRLPLNLVIGAFVGVLLALAAVLARETADRRLRSVEDVQRDLLLPVLGSLMLQSAKPDPFSSSVKRGNAWPWLRWPLRRGGRARAHAAPT